MLTTKLMNHRSRDDYDNFKRTFEAERNNDKRSIALAASALVAVAGEPESELEGSQIEAIAPVVKLVAVATHMRIQTRLSSRPHAPSLPSAEGDRLDPGRQVGEALTGGY